jgi:threonylcarbamoyladenosine tRNA methylthiotransferase MtaB
MPGQHPNAVKEERSHRAIAVAEEMTAAYRRSMIGSVQEVLFEEPSEGLFTGHAPNYIRVYAQGEDLHNEIRQVRITGIFKDGLMGTIE